jgi:hypothetical protein
MWLFVQMFFKHLSPVLVVLRDFSVDVLSLTTMSSTISSVGSVCFLSGFLSSNYPFFFVALKFSGKFSSGLVFKLELH